MSYSSAVVHWPADDRVVDLVFVGIDGVLHPVHRGLEVSERFACLPRLESVLREFPTVKVVLTGSYCNRCSLEDLRAHFSADIATRVVGLVPGSGRRRRQRRIDRYLELHRLKATAWLAIDRWSEHVGDFYVWCIEGFQEGEECLLRVYLEGGLHAV